MEDQTILAFLFFSALAIGAIIFGIKKSKQNKMKANALGYDYEHKIESGTYVHGHPDIDEQKKTVYIIPKEEELHILFMLGNENLMPPKLLGIIPKSAISEIIVEDQSTFEKRLTLARVALVGVFALAWKKKKKNELAYLTINWNDNKFNNETVFEFEGKSALNKANTCSNNLKKLFR